MQATINPKPETTALIVLRMIMGGKFITRNGYLVLTLKYLGVTYSKIQTIIKTLGTKRLVQSDITIKPRISAPK
jgi:hypothetical protein